MSLREAFLHTKTIRKIVKPNKGFMDQLRVFEKDLFGKASDMKEFGYPN